MQKSEQVIIRCAGRSDLEAVRGILNYYVIHTPYLWTERVRNTRDMARMYRTHQYSDRTPMMVAERERRILGFSALSPVSSNEGWQEVAEDMVYLHPDCTGQGLGTLLLEAVMERGQKTGLWAVMAKIDAENVASLALHRTFGFEECGILKDVGIYAGQRRSCVQMIYYYSACDEASIKGKHGQFPPRR